MRPWRAALLIALAAAPSPGAGGAPVMQAIDRVVTLSGGRRIAIACRGRGRFAVLLEPGDGGRRAHMAALFDALSRRYRVCAYDRRNVGRSSAAPIPRRADDLAADAFDALAAAHVAGPYLLFGSSMGGLLVRAYAATHRVAGFVTSNQPATTREWTRAAYPVMSPAERRADAAWMAGANNEHIDADDLSRAIDRAPPPRVPYVLMISTERFQCRAAGLCDATYRAFLAASRGAAQAGPRGRFRLVDGAHDLYTTDLAAVVAEIDAVAAAASGPHRPLSPVAARASARGR